ncbi:acyl-CoA dehydrogenase family protein [Shigella flexneri]
MANDFQITHELADLPPELWAYLKEHHFFAMIVKKEYGGLEFSAYAQSRVLQNLSGVSGILAITVGVPNSLGRASCCNITALTAETALSARLARGRESLALH